MTRRNVRYQYQETSINRLSTPDRCLLLQAQAPLNVHVPYAPYSKFLVCAALSCSKISDTRLETIIGVNVENSSSSLTVCAERAAFVSAISQCYRKFDSMAVATARAEGCRLVKTEKASFSCGACVQFLREMSELSGNDIRMIFSNTRGDHVIIIKASELYRHMFGPKALGVDIQKYQYRLNRRFVGVY